MEAKVLIDHSLHDYQGAINYFVDNHFDEIMNNKDEDNLYLHKLDMKRTAQLELIENNGEYTVRASLYEEQEDNRTN